MLKSEQVEAIRHMYEGSDVFVFLPTGFGTESICFEVLPFLFDYKHGKLAALGKVGSTDSLQFARLSLYTERVPFNSISVFLIGNIPCRISAESWVSLRYGYTGNIMNIARMRRQSVPGHYILYVAWLRG